MNKVITAIAVACVLQISATLGFTSYMINHTNDVARQYALLAERNANLHSDQTTLDMYNRIQIERSQERDDLHQYIDKRIDLKIFEATHNQTNLNTEAK